MEVLCCRWDGCNSDINSAKLSKFEYEQYLLQQILGSEYDYFISSEKQRHTENDQTKADKIPSTTPIDTSNESDTSNRRVGTFQYQSIPHIENVDVKEPLKLESTFLSQGFPKNFVPKLQVYLVISLKRFLYSNIYTISSYFNLLQIIMHTLYSPRVPQYYENKG